MPNSHLSKHFSNRKACLYFWERRPGVLCLCSHQKRCKKIIETDCEDKWLLKLLTCIYHSLLCKKRTLSGLIRFYPSYLASLGQKSDIRITSESDPFLVQKYDLSVLENAMKKHNMVSLPYISVGSVVQNKLQKFVSKAKVVDFLPKPQKHDVLVIGGSPGFNEFCNHISSFDGKHLFVNEEPIRHF